MPSYRARWILPVASPPIRDGLLTVEGGRIVHVSDSRSAADTIDLGNAVLLPGLVNAHTHLEYSELDSPLGYPGTPFVDWIAQVVAWKRRRDEDARLGAERRTQAIESGLAECRRWGTTLVGEITTLPWSSDPYVGRPAASLVAFLEIIGLAADKQAELLDAVDRYLPNSGHVVPGVSPHAPYTVSRDLLSRICERSANSGFPVAMHLAESAEELQLLASRDGPFVELLETFGAWDPGAFSPGGRPLDYLEHLARCRRALVIHGNRLARDEIRFVAEHADRISVVFCPRTHAFFAHPRYPLLEMRRARINVALGTDSRASNPNLNLLDEMRHVAREYPEIAWDDVIGMGTLAGARALGCDGRTGTLEPGKDADFAVIRLPDEPGVGPETVLSDERCSISHLCHRGSLESWES